MEPQTPVEHQNRVANIAYLEQYSAFVVKFIRHSPITTFYGVRHKPLLELLYDGTMSGFQTAAGDASGNKVIREYGLCHTIPLILKNLSDVYEDEKFHVKPEINIEHYGKLLIKFVNKSVTIPIEDDIISFDIGDMLEFVRAETARSQVSKAAVGMKRLEYFVKDSDPAFLKGLTLAAIAVFAAGAYQLADSVMNKLKRQ